MALNVMGDLRARFESSLGVPAYTSMPANRPDTCVTVTREGGRRLNALQDRPGVGVYCYAPTEAEAWTLADRVADLMLSLSFSEGYELVECEAMYSDPDPDARVPRWYLSYTLTTHQPIGE